MLLPVLYIRACALLYSWFYSRQMLEGHCAWNSSHFDYGQGEGGQWAAHFYGYNPPFNPSRTEHILMSTALFLCCKQISALHEFDSADPLLCHFLASVRYRTLICGFQIRLWEEGKENIWFGGASTKTRLFHTCWKMRLSSNLIRTLYAIKNINPATSNSKISFSLAADATGMTARQMSCWMQLGLPMASWYDATCHDYKRSIRWNKKHNQPFAELQQRHSTYCRYSTYCRLRGKQYKK